MTTHSARPYQTELKAAIYGQWQSVKNTLAVLPTGGGKTFIFAGIIGENKGASCAIAHRSELVSQMSLALAREGVRHRVIGPDNVRRLCTAGHLDELGRSFYDPNALCAVAGVDTLVRMDTSDPWFQRVNLWVGDEAHHFLADNKWGRAVAMFPNAYGLGVTATPIRADGKGLGRHADGVFDSMVLGPSMRDLIEMPRPDGGIGYLTDYRVVCPPNDLDLSVVNVSSGGDYVPEQLKKARRKSCITGNVVKHYLAFARGKLGITFDTDVESATETAQAYRDAGVPAEVVSAKTQDAVRAAILRKFKAREILQLVNVDLFGEGFDVPGVEVVSMARPTMSFSLFCQQWGRALRIMEGKGRAIIIDHVGNVVRHKLPDAPRAWTLDRREGRRGSSAVNEMPMRVCLNAECMSPYERLHPACPFCGTEPPPPASRGAPEFVDGDLVELDDATLSRMRQAVDVIDGAARIPQGVTGIVGRAIYNNHWERQQHQSELRKVMAIWGGLQKRDGLNDRQMQRKFFLRYSIDVLTAATLGPGDADKLRQVLEFELISKGIATV